MYTVVLLACVCVILVHVHCTREYTEYHVYVDNINFVQVCVSSPRVLTPEVVQAINKEVIGMVKNAEFAEEYVCTLCLALMNSRRVSVC